MSIFVTLEGPDGCGKSTQAKLLAERLKSEGYPVLLTREPGGTAIGDQIRRVLMSLDNRSMHPRTEFLLFSASRSQLAQEVIRPHLDKGGAVVSDRFYDSSLAYQGYGHGLSRQQLRAITEFATEGLLPDLTLLLDVPVLVGLERRRSGGQWNRLDDYDLEFHERARQGYLELAQAEPERWQIVSADQPVGIIASLVWQWVEPRLQSSMKPAQAS